MKQQPEALPSSVAALSRPKAGSECEHGPLAVSVECGSEIWSLIPVQRRQGPLLTLLHR